MVTGAAGFIGSTLTRRLLDEGHRVTGIDAIDDYYDPAIKRRRVARLSDTGGFDFHEAHLLDAPLEELLRDVDYVFHFAGRPGVRASWGAQFNEFLRDNVLSTQRLLEAAKESPVRRIVYSSSSSVYGDAESFPTSEQAVPQPRSPYGVTKLAAEHLCRLYAHAFQVPTVSLRYFTVYGPEQRPDMAFNRFIRAAALGETIQIYGDGTQTRDFTYVDDVVQANVLAADCDEVGAVFNIGGGSRVPLLDMLTIIERLVGRPLRIEHTDTQPGDARDTAADISAAHARLGYAPQIGIEEGLARQVEWELASMAGSGGRA